MAINTVVDLSHPQQQPELRPGRRWRDHGRAAQGHPGAGASSIRLSAAAPGPARPPALDVGRLPFPGPATIRSPRPTTSCRRSDRTTPACCWCWISNRTPAAASMSLDQARAFVSRVQDQAGRWPGSIRATTSSRCRATRRTRAEACAGSWRLQCGPNAVVPPNWSADAVASTPTGSTGRRRTRRQDRTL